MQITVTAGEVKDSSEADWKEFCDITGLSVYALAEGMPKDRKFNLEKEEAEEIGLL